MSDWKYPTAFNSIDAREHAAMTRVINSGRFTMGAEVEAFENEFSEFHYRKHCIMVNSGSSANLVAVSALDRLGFLEGSGEPMAVVPALAWSTTYAPLVQNGFDLHPVDCNETWSAHPSAIKDIPDRPSVIMSVPILGHCGYTREWMLWGAGADIPVIEDCCESIWASHFPNDHRASVITGRQSIVATFSFFWSHQLNGIEGGAILTDNDEIARTCRMLRNHGWTRGLEKPMHFSDEYRFDLFGYNVRPLELHAAVARQQLDRVLGGKAARMLNWSRFAHATAGDVVMQDIGAGANPFGIAFEMPSRAARSILVARLRTAGIDCRPIAGGSLRLQPYGARWSGVDTPNADRIHDCGIMLGNAPWDISALVDEAAQYVLEVVNAAQEG